MTTDITELAQSLKRRAASANEFGEGLFFIKADDVLALLEALDNTQAENELVRGQLFIAGRTLLNQQAKIAELESRTVKLPERYACELGYNAPDPNGDILDRDAVIDALTAAGIKWEAE